MVGRPPKIQKLTHQPPPTTTIITHQPPSQTQNQQNSCAGVADVLESETRKPLAELQREDLFLLGRLLLMLGTRAPVMAPQQFPQALNAVAQSYSPDLHALCLQLCSLKPGMTVFDLAPLISRCVRASVAWELVGILVR